MPVRGTALAGLLTLLALPAAAHAEDAPTGGAVPSTGGTTPTAPAAPTTPDASTTPAAPAAASAPTSGSAELAGAGTWKAQASSAAGRPVRVTGSFRPALAGRTVQVQRRTPTGRWLRATTAKVRSSGSFAAAWRTTATGVQELRVALSAADAAKADARTAAAASETVTIAVVGRVKASWYGPGFYGRTTACGVTLQKDTVGVAHRTLPCGTQVEIRMGSRSVVAPVIDRGPFANGASFDLTKNVADEIGLDGVGTVTYLERPDVARLKTPSSAPAIR